VLVLLAYALPAATQPGSSGVRVEGPAVVKARTAALLVSDMSGGGLRTQVLALPWASAGRAGGAQGRSTVLVRLEIDGGGLVRSVDGPVEEGEPVPLEVFLYALSDDDEVLDAFTVRLGLDPALDREVLSRGGLALTASLELPDGTHRLRHLVWSDSRLFGLGTTEVTVSSQDPPPVAWIAERPERWLRVPLAVPDRLDIDPERSAGESGGPSPAGLPVLSVCEDPDAPRPEVEVWWRVPASGSLGAADAEERNPGAVRLVAAGAGPAAEQEGEVHVPFEVRERLPEAQGTRLLRVSFPAPRLAPGRYLLSLHPAEGSSTQPVPVLVAPVAAGEVWTRVLAGDQPADGEAEDAAPPDTPRPARTVARALPEEDAFRQQAREDYRRVVAGLVRRASSASRGEPADDPTDGARSTDRITDSSADTAAGELARREAELLEGIASDDLNEALALLTATQRETAAEMLGPRAAGAPALALLHGKAAGLHYRAGRWRLADLAAEQAARLAEGHAAIVGTPQARRDAAGLLTWLAADLRTAGRGRQALAMFQRSLAVEETDTALLGLATLLERSGRPADAVPPLERLLERRPDHREARLRLAVSLARLGRTEAAREHLRRVVWAADRSWMTVVAYQELARFELAAGDCVGAVRVLRSARDLFPDQPQLAVQMSWALECAGERAGARELAAQLVERARRGATSAECPRMRYTRWNQDTVAEERERLGELARRARQALARDLEGLEEGK